MAQFDNRNDFNPCFLCRKVIPCFLVHPLLAIGQSKSVCVIQRISVCALTRIFINCTSTNYVDVPELPSSKPGTQPLVMLLCGFFWRSTRNHYLLVLVLRALAMSIRVRTYLPKFKNEMHYYYYHIIPTGVPWGFF